MAEALQYKTQKVSTAKVSETESSCKKKIITSTKGTSEAEAVLSADGIGVPVFLLFLQMDC